MRWAHNTIPMASSRTASMIFLSFALLVFSTFERASCAAAFTNATCIEREREALLEFKRGLVDKSNLLSSWVGDDCCSWKGVRCSKLTGRVLKLDLRSPCVVPFYFGDVLLDQFLGHGNCTLTGHIHPSLAELQHLNYLDLSWNNFSYAEIPEFLGSLSNLVYLNLSNVFAGKVPCHLGNLSNLQYLDLNNFRDFIQYVSGYATVNNLEWLSGLPSLKHLDLSGNSVRNAQQWLQSISMLSSLQFLGLADCSLPISDSTLQVNFSTSLEFLDLCGNNIGIGSTIPNWLLNLSSTTHLDLSGVFSNFDGGAVSFPTEIINNNKQLAFLDLRYNSMRGELPKNLSNLCHLFALKLGGNDLTGGISAALGNPFSCLQNTLRYLDLQGNKISGRLGDEIRHFKNLEYIGLSGNSIEGPIPVYLPQLSSLKELDLGYNNLTGGIPESIGQMSNLFYLVLSNNLLKGVVTELHLANLTSLTWLDISSNELAVKINPKVVPHFNLI
ncbi:receptor-like protein EIX2 isoform X1 [Punica granatum]|uniref:Receptor-like protein EIX2 isoform X1 n=1 Tax=Punica granatum TaxID=22663 RepID=A0A6P8CTJ3_PUNGR|nr:receptor-like protein EIX2 isoform X1 [Punica granatum]XP_031383046.1 receptor-like protein EIX2 isoform X1 [Punica granatum]XP_031383048.1 receptor-like protein EIX2 isoform X1 [Punica granatum]